MRLDPGDKNYHGVSTIVPFKGMFINPISREEPFPVNMYQVAQTMLHELAHFNVRSHNFEFPAEMQRIQSYLQAAQREGKFDYNGWLENFVDSMEKYNDIIRVAHTEFERASNAGKSFTDGQRMSTGEEAGGDEGLRGGGGGPGETGERAGGVSRGDDGGAEAVGQQRQSRSVRGGDGEGARPIDAIGSAGGEERAGATQASQAIDRVFRDQYLTKLFEDAKAAGMTAEEWKRYSRALAELKFDGREKLVQKRVWQLIKQKQPEFIEEMAQQKAIVEVAAGPRSLNS